ncbi:MAG: type I restriction endonuclease subunit R [Calditrichia bacterium]
MNYTEDTLVQQTTAEYLEQQLGWESVYAYNNEDFGPESLLGRSSDREVVLTRYLRAALVELNPGLPEAAYEEAVRQLVSVSAAQSLLATNREKYRLLREGIPVTYRNANNERERRHLKVINYEHPEENHFLCVRELWVRGDLYRRRADIVGFVNGIPLLFMECKNIDKNLQVAYQKNYSDYLDTIPHLFHHNGFVVFANGEKAKMGSITSGWEHFAEWKRLAEEEPGVVDMETLLKGVCNKRNFIDLLENFILFDDSGSQTRKIIARNHQFLGVNRAIEAVRYRQNRQGKLGVFWHTQGAGKSYSMIFFTRKIHRKLGGNFTFLILTDREDLDTQIYKSYAGCGVVDNDRDPCRAASGRHLNQLLQQHKAYVFSLIQKFNREVEPEQPYSDRDDIIVISDEAHRTQYGTLALNLRTALPNASYIGFTGTPLFKDDEITRRVFGDYVSTYDFSRAVEDNSTVPLYYDARGEKLKVTVDDLNERIAEKLEELEISDVDVEQRLQQELQRDYHIITAERRLDQIARDFVNHYCRSWKSGKAMFICIDKITCVRMYNLIAHYWQDKIRKLERAKGRYRAGEAAQEYQEFLTWMNETRMAVVISEEQNEVKKFENWGLDIRPHRRLIKEGIELPESLREKPQYKNKDRLELDVAFKDADHPFRIAIVCAMWLTGFDVPSLANLYLDKPLKAHTLMQAIARANRVHEGKNNGLIVDYCGILRHLRKALATYAGTADTGHQTDQTIDPTRPEKELLEELEEAIGLVKAYLGEKSVQLEDIISREGFARNAAIAEAKEVVNENDETRKRFEVLCREVFKKFKACLTVRGVNRYRADYQAINIVYKSLQQDRENVDISDIIQELHQVVDEAIDTHQHISREREPFDISKIDFELLRQEFSKFKSKNTLVQNLKHALEKRLKLLLLRNPLRADFQKRYEEIVAAYNREKDRVNIEQTFDALLKLTESLKEEELRAVREGLDEESLAIFDLLKKENLSKSDIEKIKKVSKELLQNLKAQIARIEHWQDRESSRDAVQLTIRDFLWSEETGLPVGIYSDEEVSQKAEEVFRHVYRVYPTVPSPYYTGSKVA